MPQILKGTLLGQTILKKVSEDIQRNKIKPTLNIIRIGDNESSKIYVREKKKQLEKINIKVNIFEFENNIDEETIFNEINKMNKDKKVSGIIIQLPLPTHLDWKILTEFISPEKDVDGLNSINIGLRVKEVETLFPATAIGIIELLNDYNIPVENKIITILGRSHIVGKPLFDLLLSKNATVNLAHSKTPINILKDYCKNSDIIISAVGKPGILNPDIIGNDKILIDVGISRVEKLENIPYYDKIDKETSDKFKSQIKEKGYFLIGDFHPTTLNISKAYSPVPGGVGPLTIACLARNTVEAFKNLSSH